MRRILRRRRRIEEAVEDGPMLAEKFFLMLETLISRIATQTTTYADGAPKVISQSQFVPMKLPESAK